MVVCLFFFLFFLQTPERKSPIPKGGPRTDCAFGKVYSTTDKDYWETNHSKLSKTAAQLLQL